MRRLGLLALAAAAAWLFLRPRTIVCPQCRGRGAPPLEDPDGRMHARLCATCGVSATPDLPLFGMPSMDPDLSEGIGP